MLAEQARASYEDGVLEVEIPLAKPDQSIRRVPIEAEDPHASGGPPHGGQLASTSPLPKPRPPAPRSARRSRGPSDPAAARQCAVPETLTPLAIGQQRSIQLVNDVLGGNRMLVVASEDPEQEEPRAADLYGVGVAGVVARMLKVPDGTLRILVHGAQRVEIGDFVSTDPYLVARIVEAPDELEPSPELEALHRNVQSTFSRIIEELPYLPEELQIAVANLDDPSELAHMIAGALRIKTEEKQQLLEERDVAERLRLLSEILARELELVEIGSRSSRRSNPRWRRVSASTSCANS